MTATARGREEGRERGDDRDVVALVDAAAVVVGRRDREGAPRSCRARARARRRSPRPRTPAASRALSRHHLGDEALDAGRGRALGELLEQARPDAAPLELVGDRERDLGARGVAQPRRSSPARRSAPSPSADSVPTSAPRLVPVGIDERLDERRARAWGSRGSGGRGSAPRARRRTRRSASTSAACGETQPQRAAVAEDDVREAVDGEWGSPVLVGRPVGGVRDVLWQLAHSALSRSGSLDGYDPTSAAARVRAPEFVRTEEGPLTRALWSLLPASLSWKRS